jgi:NitT/TauT family transport system permease protein
MDMTAGSVIAPVGNRAGSAADEMDRQIFAERRAAKRRTALLTWILRVGLLVAFVGGWYYASHNGLIDPLLISSPDAVAKAFIDQLTTDLFWTDVASTFSGAMSGLVGGAILGVLTGLLFSRSAVLARAAAPFLTLLNSLPRPALAPIFILWFGLGYGPKAMVAGSVVYFVLLTNTSSALLGIDHDIDQLARSMSMSARQRFFKIEFPTALPSIVGGLRLGAVYAVLGAVVSEMVGAYTGLGQRLVIMTNNFKIAESFAVLLAMGLMSMTIDYAISGLQRLVRSRTR